jgi:hypothetical protein
MEFKTIIFLSIGAAAAIGCSSGVEGAGSTDGTAEGDAGGAVATTGAAATSDEDAAASPDHHGGGHGSSSGGSSSSSGSSSGAGSSSGGSGSSSGSSSGAGSSSGSSSSSSGSSSGGGSSSGSSGSSSGSSSGAGSSSGSSSGGAVITGLNGKTYYVAPTGSDSNAGTAAAPWKTIQQAGGIVQPGDTVLVRAGTYDGAIFGWDTGNCKGDPYCTVAGTATNPILFEADPSAAAGSVVIAAKNSENKSGFDLEPGCNYVDLVGFTVTNGGTADTAAGSITKAGIAFSGVTGNKILGNTVNGISGVGGIFVDTATNVLVQGNTVLNTVGTGDTGHGMYVSGSSTGVQVIGNVLHDNAYVGLHVNGDVSEGLPGVVSALLVSGNSIYKNGQNGINADGLQHSTIENNLIYDNARNGIELYQIDASGGSIDNVIVNNTIDQSMISGAYAIEISACDSQPLPPNCQASTDSSTGNVAFDNILLGKGGSDSVVSSADLSLGTNITATSATLFASAGSYTLAPTGPGTGTGVASFGGLTAPATATGTHDIGAFSFAQ